MLSPGQPVNHQTYQLNFPFPAASKGCPRRRRGIGLRRRLRMRRRLEHCFSALALVCVVLGSCLRHGNGAVNTPSPLPIAKVAATPIQGKTSIVAVPANPVGNVQPVYVWSANGTGNPMLESSGEIFALGADESRVPVLPPQEAAHQAGGSAEAGVKRGNRLADLRGTVSRRRGGHCRPPGICNLGRGSVLSGSLIGSAVGLVMGAGAGLYQAHAAAETRAQEQIQSLSLKATTIPPNGTESGSVFFPLGEYQKIQAVSGRH